MTFCQRPTRLFSGEPDALFAQDADRFTTGVVLAAALSSPFHFQMDTQQCPYTVQWHLNKLRVIFYSTQGLSNIESGKNAVRLFLCPNSMVGAQFTTTQIDGINPQNVGVEIAKTQTDQVDDFPQGLLTFFWGANTVDVPPGWFLRLCILDGGGGPNFLRAGDTIRIDCLRNIVPVKFMEGN